MKDTQKFDATLLKRALNREVNDYTQLGHSSKHYTGYVSTNENLRATTRLTADFGKRVLTIAGSGDHPLFYALNGAEHIDTFDISYGARAIMDIKTAAISEQTREQYYNTLERLYMNNTTPTYKIVAPLLQKIPHETADFITAMDTRPICIFGQKATSFPETILTDTEYKQLANQIKQPFNFIWSDAAHVHEYLTQEYDVINLSNIFEWNSSLIIPTLHNLSEFVRPGGHIIANTSSADIMGKQFQEAAQALRHILRYQHLATKSKQTHADVFQRI